jgi:PilZ domain
MIPTNTRRWPRHEVDLPVGVVLQCGPSRTLIPGRGTEISEGGMSVYAAVDLKPYDLMEIEFQQPSRTQITGIVRNRVAYCFGLEFLTPLSALGDPGSHPPINTGSSPAPEPQLLTPEAAKIFERLRATNGNAFAYTLLARVLNAAGWPAEARRAADRAVNFFLQTKDAYLRQKELETARMRREIEMLRQLEPFLAEGQHQENIGPELVDLIRVLPKLLGRK